MRIHILVLLFLSFVSIVGYSQNKPVRIKTANDQLSIVLPKGFEQTKSFNGFINPKSASSILLYHINSVGYIQYLDSLGPSYFESQKLVVVNQKTYQESAFFGEFIECQYMVDTNKFSRVFFVTGSDTETTLFLMNYPSVIDDEMKKTVLETIRTIENE